MTKRDRRETEREMERERERSTEGVLHIDLGLKIRIYVLC